MRLQYLIFIKTIVGPRRSKGVSEQAWTKNGVQRVVSKPWKSHPEIGRRRLFPFSTQGLHVLAHVALCSPSVPTRGSHLAGRPLIRSCPAAPGTPPHANEASPAPWPMVYTHHISPIHPQRFKKPLSPLIKLAVSLELPPEKSVSPCAHGHLRSHHRNCPVMFSHSNQPHYRLGERSGDDKAISQ